MTDSEHGKRKVTIFYSWQSDLPNNTNRGFIGQALQKAIDTIKADTETVLEPALDRDTQGVAGSPEIASTIFRKIDECQVFVGDVSIINAVATSGRKTPNPNVLLELGYSAKALTWDNVICVLNTAYGRIEDLPFDLRPRRICTYEVTKDQPSKAEEREALAKTLQAALRPILERLSVQLQEEATPKPLTPEVAGERVKEYLSDDRYRIKLKDLVLGQANELASKVVGPEFPASIPTLTPEILMQRVHRYEEIRQVALAMMVEGCYHGTLDQVKFWVDLLQRVANPQGERGGYEALLDLRRYPALLLLYGGGMAAVAGGHYGTLRTLLTKPKITHETYGKDMEPLYLLSSYKVIKLDHAQLLVERKRLTPLSDHLFDVLREPFRVLLPSDRDYQHGFDRFEYLRTLLEVEETGDVRSLGCFAWRGRLPGDSVREEVASEEQAEGLGWPPYQARWFGSKRERFLTAKQKVDGAIAQLGWR